LILITLLKDYKNQIYYTHVEMILPKHTLLLIVILAAASIYFIVDGFYGMSPGTLDQLQSTSVNPIRTPYFIF
jgi:hypothetical protein